MAADTQTTLKIIDGNSPAAPQNMLVGQDGSGNIAHQVVLRTNGAQTSPGNPQPVADAAAEALLAVAATAALQTTGNAALASIVTETTAAAGALGTTSDAAWGGSGVGTVIALLKALTKPAQLTLVPLDIAIVTTGGSPVTALSAGHRTAGGWIKNPENATANLGINEIGTAAGASSSGNTTFIVPGETYKLQPSALGVSVISSDAAHVFSGMGYQ